MAIQRSLPCQHNLHKSVISNVKTRIATPYTRLAKTCAMVLACIIKALSLGSSSSPVTLQTPFSIRSTFVQLPSVPSISLDGYCGRVVYSAIGSKPSRLLFIPLCLHVISSRTSRIWSVGSVGRAHRSHRWGHWFESSTDHQAARRAAFLFTINLMLCEVDNDYFKRNYPG